MSDAKPIRLGITGSIRFNDYDLLLNTIHQQFDIHSIDMIITGNSQGADRLAAMIARAHGIPYAVFRTDHTWGRQARLYRNTKICNNSTFLIVCGEGESRYMQHCKDYAYRMRLPILPVYIPAESPG